MILTFDQINSKAGLKIVSDDVAFSVFADMFNAGVSVKHIRIGAYKNGTHRDFFETAYVWFLLTILVDAEKHNNSARVAKIRSLTDDN